MTPFVYFYLILSLAVFPIVWLKGGHAERMGVAVCIGGYLATYAVQYVRIGEFRLGEAVCDLVILGIFAWMAFRRNRWWPFAAAAVMVLTLGVHASVLLEPAMTSSGDVSARLGLGILLLFCLLAGVGERWLAGERPVANDARWRSAGTT